MVSSNRLLHYLRTKNGENKYQFPQNSYLYNASSISTHSADMMGKCVFVLKKFNTIYKGKHGYPIFTSCKAVVPNLFGTRDRFFGRQCFHGLGGWFQHDSSTLHSSSPPSVGPKVEDHCCKVTISYTRDQIHQLLKEVLQIRYICILLSTTLLELKKLVKIKFTDCLLCVLQNYSP